MSDYRSNTVKEYADRICNLENERDVLGEDIKEVLKEADANGIDKKAIKDAVKIKRNGINKAHCEKVNDYLEQIGEPPLFAVNS